MLLKKVFGAPVMFSPSACTLAFATGVIVPVMVSQPEMVYPVDGPGTAGYVTFRVVFSVSRAGAGSGGM